MKTKGNNRRRKITKKYGDTTNELMKHIRNKNSKTSINGSVDKINLATMGYFHGYKGCKFYVKPKRHYKNKPYYNKKTHKYYMKRYIYVKAQEHDLPISNKHKFRKIKYIYNTDKDIRLLFYPIVMQLEIALKNYTIESITHTGGAYLNSIFNKCMINYKNTSNSYKLNKSFSLRGNLDKTISDSHNIVLLSHYRKYNHAIPLWAIFQIITLGQFAFFLSCVNLKYRKKIEKNIFGDLYLKKYHNKEFDCKYEFLCKHVYILKNLRNAIVHNEMIFDCRFMGNTMVAKNICNQLKQEFDIKNIDFHYIPDFLILMVFYQCHLKMRKGLMEREIKELIHIMSKFRRKFDKNHNQIYNICFGSDAIPKLDKAYKYVKRNIRR